MEDKKMGLVKFYNKGNAGFPFADMPVRFNSLLDELFTDSRIDSNPANWIPAVNISEKTNAYSIDISLPGIDKKDVKIEIEEGMLHVSGQRNEEVKEENEKFSLREIRSGSFKRSFRLPETADTEKVSASMNNGILNLEIAKKEEAKTNKREIQVS